MPSTFVVPQKEGDCLPASPGPGGGETGQSWAAPPLLTVKAASSRDAAQGCTRSSRAPLSAEAPDALHCGCQGGHSTLPTVRPPCGACPPATTGLSLTNAFLSLKHGVQTLDFTGDIWMKPLEMATLSFKNLFGNNFKLTEKFQECLKEYPCTLNADSPFITLCSPCFITCALSLSHFLPVSFSLNIHIKHIHTRIFKCMCICSQFSLFP